MANMKLKPGVLTGSQFDEVLEYCKEQECALPSVNVIGSSSMAAALQAAKEARAPVMVQFSNGGAHFNAGKFADNSNQQAAIAGALAGAYHLRRIAELYEVPVIVHTDHAAKKAHSLGRGHGGRGRELLQAARRTPLFFPHVRPF